MLSKILTSTPSSFSLDQEGNKPLVTRSNLNTNALSTDVIKARFHLQPMRELLANGFVHDDVANDIRVMVHKLEMSCKEKKKTEMKKSVNKISYYFKKAGEESSEPKNDSDDDDDEEEDDDDDDNDSIQEDFNM